MNTTWTPADWESLFTEELACPVRVVYGRSRTTPVHARGVKIDGSPGLQVRLHRMFSTAPGPIRDDLARWLRVGRRAQKACERLDQWIELSLAALPKKTRRPPTPKPAGLAHDLSVLSEPLWDGVFGEDFLEGPRPTLTWGQRRASSSRHSLRLGSYDPELNSVRIHPVLDQDGVPEWFVRYVLMHEILHAALPPRQGSGRRWIHHGPEFQARERAYGDYGRALEWEADNLPGLIRSARTGKKFLRPTKSRWLPGIR